MFKATEKMASSLLLIGVLIMVLQTSYSQVFGGGHCPLSRFPVKAGQIICEQLCYTRGIRGPPPFACNRVRVDGVALVCGGGCCRSGRNCLQLLRT